MSFNHTPWFRYWYENHDIPKPSDDDVTYHLVDTPETYNESLQKFKQSDDPWLSVDTETDGELDHTQANMIGICYGFGRHEAYYMPLGHFKGKNIDEKYKDRWYEDILYEHDGEVLFFNARFDMRILREHGCEVDRIKKVKTTQDEPNFFDTSVLVYNMDMDAPTPKLERIKEKVFGWEPEQIDNTKLHYYDPERVLPYGAGDAHATYLILDEFEKFRNAVKKPIAIDNRQVEALMHMEEIPKRLDQEHFYDLKIQYENKLDQIERKVYEAFDTKFKVSSKKQLRGILNERGIDTGAETETGLMQVDEDALEGIKDQHEGIKYVLEYRKVNKQKTTYVEPYINDLSQYDTKNIDMFSNVKPTGYSKECFAYRNTKTGTGRLSAGKEDNNDFFIEANCQNLTKEDKVRWKVQKGDEVFGYKKVRVDTEGKAEEQIKRETDFKAPKLEKSIRHGIKPPKGWYWISTDYSGQEPVILANVSGDENMTEELLKPDGDIHCKTRDEVLEKYGDYSRDDAKGLLYCVLYGGSKWRVKQLLDLDSVSDAEKILDELWNTYPGVKAWREKKQRESKRRNREYVENYWGRRRWLDFLLESDEDWIKGKADRRIGNTPIQGMGSELTKVAVIRMYKRMSDYDDFQMEFQVHDETNGSSDPSNKDRFIDRCKEQIECLEFKVPGWNVPLEADIEIGTSFGSLFPCKIENDELLIAGEYPI